MQYGAQRHAVQCSTVSFSAVQYTRQYTQQYGAHQLALPVPHHRLEQYTHQLALPVPHDRLEQYTHQLALPVPHDRLERLEAQHVDDAAGVDDVLAEAARTLAHVPACMHPRVWQYIGSTSAVQQ